jgi:hypothetical protein
MPDAVSPDGAANEGSAEGATVVAPFRSEVRPSGITDVELAVFEGEAVLFDVQASMVHHLNAVAGATWLCCDGETSVAEMIDELAEIFSITGQVDVEALADAVRDSLEQFAAQGLLVDRPVPARFTTTLDPVLAADGTEILPAPPNP